MLYGGVAQPSKVLQKHCGESGECPCHPERAGWLWALIPFSWWQYSRPTMVQRRNTILFSVRVPVLSEKMYWIWPRSSVMLRARHWMDKSVSSSYRSRSLWRRYTCPSFTSSMDTYKEMGINTCGEMDSHCVRTQLEPCSQTLTSGAEALIESWGEHTAWLFLRN